MTYTKLPAEQTECPKNIRQIIEENTITTSTIRNWLNSISNDINGNEELRLKIFTAINERIIRGNPKRYYTLIDYDSEEIKILDPKQYSLPLECSSANIKSALSDSFDIESTVVLTDCLDGCVLYLYGSKKVLRLGIDTKPTHRNCCGCTIL